MVDQQPTANGGTELMVAGLAAHVDADLLSNFQIVASRLREHLDPTKIRVFWAHDVAGDPESEHLANGGWRNYHKLVFVSHWQAQGYIARYNIPWSHTVVLQNALDPIEPLPPHDDDVKRIVYTPTPHRGLALLVDAFERLHEDEPGKVHLDVFSSFNLYGWPARDEAFEPLYQRCRDHEGITYHGTVDNATVRHALARADIFAYPSVWQETSCLCLLEAMSAGLLCVHPSLGALPETAANWSFMYPFDENPHNHAAVHYQILKMAVNELRVSEDIYKRLQAQRQYVRAFYSWELRAAQWAAVLSGLAAQIADRSLPKPSFSYRS